MSLRDFKSLVEVIQERTESRKGITFIEDTDKETAISYHDLYKRALNILYNFQYKGVKPGEELVFQIDDNYDFLSVFWACLLGKIIPVPVTVGKNEEHRSKLFNIWKNLSNPNLIISKRDIEILEVFSSEKENLWDKFSKMKSKAILLEEIHQKEGKGEAYIPGESDLAFIQFSSGSTGNPKGVVLTHKNIIVNIKAMLSGIKAPPGGDTFFSWMPLTHDMGIIGFHLTPLYAGWNQYLMPTKLFVRRPKLWMRKVSEHKITLTASPNSGYKLFLRQFKPESNQDLDLSSLRLIANGAEPISPELCCEFLDTLAPFGLKKSAMFPVYGLAEASLGVSFSDPDSEIIVHKMDRKSLYIGDKVVLKKEADTYGDEYEKKRWVSFVEVGKPIRDCYIRIKGEHGQEVDKGIIGHILIKGGNVTSGYCNKEGTDSDVLNDGWLDTGDLGIMLNDRLIVVGPEKDIIFKYGQNYYAHDIERIAEGVEGIEQGKIVATGFLNSMTQEYETVLFIHYRSDVGKFIPIAIELRKYIIRKVGLAVDSIIPVKEILKTTSGKVQRFKMVERYCEGYFDEEDKIIREAFLKSFAAGEIVPPYNSTEEKILQIWKEVFKENRLGMEIEFGVTHNFLQLGGDSTDAIKILNNVEDEFNVKLDQSLLFKEQTVRDIAAIVDSIQIIEHKKVDEKEYKKAWIEIAEKQDYYPLSSAQKRIYVMYKMDESSFTYNLPQVMQLEGQLDVERLKAVFKTLIDRHPSLRTCYKVHKGESIQKIHEMVDMNFVIEIEENAIKKYVGWEWVITDKLDKFIRPFDLTKAPLLRVKLLKINQKEHFLFIDVHHIAADGTSLVNIFTEMAALYNGETLPNLPLQYTDYVLWEEAQRDLEKIKHDEVYWLKEYEGDIPILDLPYDYPRLPRQSFEGKMINFGIDEEETAALNSLAKDESVSLFVILVTFFNIFLSKLSSKEDIVIGTATAGRRYRELRNIVGMFVNTLPLRNKPVGDTIFIDFLKKVHQNFTEAFENQGYPFEKLVEQENVQRDMSRNPIFDVMLVLQNLGKSEICFNELILKRTKFRADISRFDLTIFTEEVAGLLEMDLEFNTALFKIETIHKFISYFKSIVSATLNNPRQPLKDIDILSEDEKKQILYDFNTTQSNYPLDKNLHQLFEEQVLKNPNNIALEYEEKKVTYKKLDDLTDKLAAKLQAVGIIPNSIVGMLCDRSIEAIVSIMGILKAGGAYLPIDPEYPHKRKNYIIKDSGIHILLIEKALGQRKVEFPDDKQEIKNIIVDYKTLKEESISGNFKKIPVNSENLAYVIYTSGTTGYPKGTLLRHRNVINYVWWGARAYVKGETVSFPLFTSLAFDLTVTSIFIPLITGNKIVIYRDSKEGLLIERVVRESKVDIIKLTPSHLKSVYQLINKTSRIKTIIVGGEELKTDIARMIDNIFKGNINIYNEYGPTETAVGCTIHRYDKNKDTGLEVPIGKPADNVRIYVLDKNKKPLPLGVIGEIYIGGEGVAAGYLKNQTLTEEKFIDNPFVPGEKMYKSGDLGRWNLHEILEFYGRCDDQLKIRGYRIELGEIEKQLLKIAGIKDAVVAVRKGPQAELYAYLVTQEEKALDVSQLREALSRELPLYMLPAEFVQVEAIPLTRNSKVDFKKLQTMGRKLEPTHEYTAPHNEMETMLAEIWATVLGFEKIGIKDDFFDALGGDSIKAVQIAARLNDAGKSINVKDILTLRNIANICAHVDFDSHHRKYEQGTIAIEKGTTPIESWFLAQDFPNPNHYNQSVLLEFKIPVDISLLERVFEKLIVRHDGLRLNYNPKKNLFYLNDNLVEILFMIDVVDLSDVSAPERDVYIKKRGYEFKGGFDISSGLLMRAVLFKAMPERDRLLLILHHLVTDGITWRIILEDIYNLYEALNMQKQVELPRKTASLADWYDALVMYRDSGKLEKEKQHWQEVEKSEFRLPYDREPGNVDWSVKNQETVNTWLDREETGFLLKDAHEVYKTDVQILVTAALVRTLRQWTGKQTVIIEMENHGRHIEDIDTSKTIGWFTTIYPLLVSRQDKTIGDEIKTVKEAIRKTPGNGIGYGILKYMSEAGKTMETKRAEIRFNYLGQFDREVENPLFSYIQQSTGADVALENHMTAAIEINAMILNDVFTVDINYNKEAFKESTITSFAGNYLKSLEEILEHIKNEDDVHFTPSDFDTVDLGEDDLAALFE